MKKELLEKMFNSNKNIIVNGDIASGKTKCVMLPAVENMINRKENLMILDSKEEYINQCYEKLKKENYNIIVLNLRDLDKSNGWNPLQYPYELYKKGDKDNAIEYIEKIGRVLFYENPSQDPFWGLTASDFFTGICIGLFEDAANEKEVNFNSINSMLNGIDKKYGVEDYITMYFKCKGEESQAYTYAATTILAPRDTKGSILSIVRQKLRVFASHEKLSQLMNRTTFNIEEITNNPTAIIVIGRDENRSLNNLVTIFIEQIYSKLIDKKTSLKFNFILDNFDIIEKSNDLIDMLSSCLSRNMKFYIVTRSLEKQMNIYGSYIEKLCDEVLITSKDIKLNINDEQVSIEKNVDEIEIIYSNIEYPILKKEEIRIFNLEKKVNDIKALQLSQKFDLKPLPELPKKDMNVSDLIKQIDKKIAEIEAQERLDDKKKNIDD